MLGPFRSACAALALIATGARAQSPVVGWTYTTNVTVDSGGSGRHATSMKQQVIDGKARIDILSMPGMAGMTGADGMYQLINSVDSTVTVVMAGQRVATIMGAGAFGAFQRVKLTPHVTNATVDDLGDGESIQGHPTRHVRVTNEGTIDVSYPGGSCTGQLRGVVEEWIAADVALRPVLEGMSKTMGSLAGMSDQLSTIHSPPDLPPGTALRSITRSARKNAEGQPITVTTTTEFADLAHGPIDTVVFSVPKDFTIMDMRGKPMLLPLAVDSAANAVAVKAAKSVCESGGAP